MPDRSNQVRPEAELEALLSATLSSAFSLIPKDQFRHQTRFAVQLGHNEHIVDGERLWSAAGRADIVLFYQDRPLAVVELKRQDKALLDADRRQGLSYAQQMTPRPPLVIITNGQETRIYETSTGDLWSPNSHSAIAISRVFDNAAKIAAAGMAWAIEVLMGPEAGLWASAVRAQTKKLISDLSAAAGDTSKPFVHDLHFSRDATWAVIHALDEGHQVVFVTGSPQLGKSHILKELAETTSESTSYALFMIRANQGGLGLFQRIANLLSASLEWKVDANDVRQWLRRLSELSAGPALVIALDGLAGDTAVAADLEELCEIGFGRGLRIVAATDDIQKLVLGANGRDDTALSRVAVEVEVSPLNEDEWIRATEVLSNHRIHFTRGAEFALEYRIPWILRILFANIVSAPEYQDKNISAAVPATLGVGLVYEARRHLSRYGNAQVAYRLLARDAINDAAPVSYELSLERTFAFVIRRDALSASSREVVGTLISQGWLTAYRHAGKEDVIVPTAPELFVSELAHAVSTELTIRSNHDAQAAGYWLADLLDGVFLGDLIGAQAVIDLAATQGGYSSGIVFGLLDKKPEIEQFGAGRFSFSRPDGSLQDVVFSDDGATLVDGNGIPLGPPIEVEAGDRRLYKNLSGWMILSQLAAIPAESLTDDRARIDLTILLEVGTCPIPLMRVARAPIGHFVHDVKGHGSVLCPDNGVVEPATAAMQMMFSIDYRGLGSWFDEALSKRSLPLLNRILIALREVRRSADAEKSSWANDLLTTRVNPAIAELLAG